ncbi:MAG: hypothetical protein QXT83_05620 [Sulfolobales archaeon]
MYYLNKLVGPTELYHLLTYPKDDVELGIKRYAKLRELGIVGIYDYGPTLINGIRVLGKGHSSVVFLARHDALGDVAVKVRRADSKRDSLAKEGYLMSLDKFNVVPKVYYFDDDVIIMEYLNGVVLGDYLKNANTNYSLVKVVSNVVIAAYMLDLDLIDHLELTNPTRHVFILEDLRVRFVDFESARISPNPCNLCRITSYFINLFGMVNTDVVKEYLRKYKSGMRESYRDVLKALLLSKAGSSCSSV